MIAITDSGIEWCDPGIVDKIYVNRGAVPPPENAQGLTTTQLAHRGVHFTDSDPYDLNDDGAFNVADYANDPRIQEPYFCATPANQDGFGYSRISPMDLIRTFGTKGSRYYYGKQSPTGFTEAISGWNFLDNNNNPYDDVHYDHGTGEAEDSNGAADSIGQEVGTCPSCMVMPIRAGESFVAQSDAFAQGVMFAVDSGASVIQEALGTIDLTTTTARQAVSYAIGHGVPIVASAADEEAEHHNLPAVLAHTLVVNSTTQGGSGLSALTPPSYLYLNGCTNYGANVAVTVESSSCSSEATGKTGGIVGLAESEADNLVVQHKLSPYPGLKTVSGAPVALSPNEVQQLVTMNADTIDFQTAALPFGTANNNAVVGVWPTTRYPSQPSYDMYTGYGRINAGKILHSIASGRIPPEAQINSPDWFQTLSPGGTLSVTGMTAAVRASSYTWELEAGAGTSPEPDHWYLLASGRGSRPRTGLLASVPVCEIATIFPAGTSFGGGPSGAGGTADPDRFSFTLRLVVKDNRGVIGMDRRTDFLHSDPTLLPGYPKQFGGSVDAAPTLAPIGPHGQDALIVATADGQINAYRPNGRELPGWPVYTAPDPVHLGEPAYTSHAVTSIPRGSVLGGVAVGDLANSSGHSYDIVAGDYSGHVYAWTSAGKLLRGFPVRTAAAYSSPPARGPVDRLQRGFEGAPALAPLQGGKRLDIVASVDGSPRVCVAAERQARPRMAGARGRSLRGAVDQPGDEFSGVQTRQRGGAGDAADRHARDRGAERLRPAGRGRRRGRGVQRPAERVRADARQLRDRELRRHVVREQPRLRDRAHGQSHSRRPVSEGLAGVDRGLRHRAAPGRRRRHHFEPVARGSGGEREAGDGRDRDRRPGVRAQSGRQLVHRYRRTPTASRS